MTKTLVVCLFLTLLLELPVAAALGLRRGDLLLCALLNVLTNPLVVVLSGLVPGWAMVAVLEVAAVAVEGGCYKAFGKAVAHPWRLSLWCNGLSFGLGLIINLFL